MPSSVDVEYSEYNCENIKRGKSLLFSMSEYAEICEFEILIHNLAYNSKLRLIEDDGQTYKLNSLINSQTDGTESKSVLLKYCQKIEISFEKRLLMESFAARVSCKENVI